MTPLESSCPQCQAQPGAECEWKQTTVRRFHGKRQAPTPSHSDVGMVADRRQPAATLYARHDPRRLGL